ncbi:MAG: C1 family peptidase [Pseudomonadota bacterium]|nr:C1 family peptidase [Pseudomonadota bacterium]
MQLTQYQIDKPRLSHHFLWVLCLSITLSLTTPANACRPSYTLGDDTLILPCIDWLSEPLSAAREVYQTELQLENAESFLFNWDFSKVAVDNMSTEVGAIYEPATYDLYIPAIDVTTAPGVIQAYQVRLQGNAEGQFVITEAILLPSQSNRRPVAESASIQANVDLTYQQVQLVGSDPDSDTLSFELLAPTSGSGYSLAYINPNNRLNIIVESGFTGNIELPYRVTDGKLFSHPALVTVTVGNSSDKAFNLGSEKLTSRDLAGRTRRSTAKLSSTQTTSQQTTLPSRVDLSDNFPQPRDQGAQNSCVGWAVGYALKSYQESVEMGWSLESNDHLFSPAFIYNQINGNGDNGSRLDNALDLVINQGVATLQAMPYVESDVTTQPSAQAQQQASSYTAREWAIIETNKDMKNALADGVPVVISMAAYTSLKSLQGTNSVYNTADTYEGEHAVTIVGYDDDKFGGAFKVMNSWGTDWGDNGYFWLTYDFTTHKVKIDGQDAGFLISTAYILLDDDNQNVTVSPTSPTDSTLPDLTIKDWQASYDPQPGGQGVFWYSIENTGQQTIPAYSVEVELVLSRKDKLFLRDFHYEEDIYILAHEEIPFEMTAGQAVTRGENNVIPFEFPTLPSGEYFLHLLVDGYDHDSAKPLKEPDKDDNISVAANSLTITNDQPLPDLVADYWYAEWDPKTGQGFLDYALVNEGGSAVPAGIGWEIALVLVSEEEIDKNGNPREFILWQHVVQKEFPLLAPGQTVESQPPPFFIDSAPNAAPFHAYKDFQGNPIPQGDYEMVFQLDTPQDVEGSGKVTEFDEDNIFFSGLFVEVGFEELRPDEPAPTGELEQFEVAPKPSDFQHSIKGDGATPPPPQDSGPTPVLKRKTDRLMKAYNGKYLPADRVSTSREVYVYEFNGRRRLEVIDGPPKRMFDKTTRAKRQVILPADEIREMPRFDNE